MLFEYAPPGTLTWGYREVKEAFAAGRIASLVLWSDLFKLLYDAENPSIEGRVGVSHVPGRRTNGDFDFRALMSGGGVMAVASSAGKPDAAFWVASAMSKNAARFVFDPRTRCDPFRYSHVADPLALSETLSDITGSQVSEKDAAEYMDAVRESMEHGVPVLTIPSSDDYIDLLDLYVHRALTGEIEPAFALESAVQGWDAISKESGYEVQKKSWRSVYTAWERLYPSE
jgi:multiple sugar transport system substrate-binding protein